MKLFMDESGNGNPSQPLIVGAIELGDDADAVETQIRDLHKRLCARASFVGHPKFEEFSRNGFHSSIDPRDVSDPFRELIRTLSFRAYMVTTDRTSVPGSSEAEQIEFMYVKLLSDLLLRNRKEPELFCIIEQSHDTRSIIGRLPESATSLARESLGKAEPLPELRVAMTAKADSMSIAIVDYVMSDVSRWLLDDCPTEPGVWCYRAFRAIEPFVSVLYSFERGPISNRKTPLH